MPLDEQPYRPPRWPLVVFAVLVGWGGVVFVTGLRSEPQRVWANLFLVGNLLCWLGVGALALIAMEAVTGAHWSLPLRRIQEGIVAVLPAGIVIVLAVLLIQPYPLAPADALAGADHQSHFRSWWLDRPFLLVRAAIYCGIWLLFARALIRAIRWHEQQSSQSPWDAKSVGLSAAFLVTFGVTCWLASTDWLMALQPGWSSTIFGVYNFAGAFLSALAAVTLLTVVLRHHAPLGTVVTADRLHILGTLLFSFSSFWMYTWYCQYMLVWYANHPDETSYLRLRWEGVWPAFVLASIVASWVVPFLVLMPGRAKGSSAVLAFASVVILAGRWLDLFVIIGPTQGGAMTASGLPEAAMGLGALGVAGLSAFWSVGRLPLVARSQLEFGNNGGRDLEETVPPLPVNE